ncbi:hypothetical protein Syun_001162 [Stephania yunnanensis]|uniref:Peptidase M1 leukotriene A4 hydrolase/aminopeptidase C-terminal domain-containing protein n=1 Tax=Stephania yunnanensis TaxID=152371 RepID=A0AAP0LF04_9MAGN
MPHQKLLQLNGPHRPPLLHRLHPAIHNPHLPPPVLGLPFPNHPRRRPLHPPIPTHRSSHPRHPLPHHPLHHSVPPIPNPFPLPYTLHPTPHPIKGQPLTISLSSHHSLLISFSTSPSSSALQWLSPSQTSSNSLPFVYTQCQPIHARSIFPCQDTPAARIRFSARLNIPEELSAVVGARHVGRGPVRKLGINGVLEEMWGEEVEGRVEEEFEMEEPIPPYLFAMAVGGIGWRKVGERTRVYGEEGVAGVLESAAREFEGTEEMIREGERLFGEYKWGRFDLLVLPPSFPYGGMENPRMGFTTYAERRIIEVVQGPEKAALNIGIGWRGLNLDVERFKDRMEFTKLRNNQEEVDPDDIYSAIPYEKGFQFLWRIECQIGRPKFDEFLKKYIATFKFQSIDTETFLDFLKENVQGIEKEIDLDTWVNGTGIPPDAYEPVSNIYNKIVSLANDFKSGRMPSEDEVADWQGQEWELYLENLPKPSEAALVTALDERFRFAESKNYEVKVAFLKLAISSGCTGYYKDVEKTLKEVGRMMYLRPLYTVLVQSPSDKAKILAKRVFEEARNSYHPIAQGVVESILAKHL